MLQRARLYLGNGRAKTEESLAEVMVALEMKLPEYGRTFSITF